jgi:hypothetical protein
MLAKQRVFGSGPGIHTSRLPAQGRRRQSVPNRLSAPCGDCRELCYSALSGRRSVKGDPAGRQGGNSRNGARGKIVLSQVGPVELGMPRDLDGSFEPPIVKSANAA